MVDDDNGSFAFKFKQPACSSLIEIQGERVSANNRPYCKLLAIDNHNNIVFFKGNEAGLINYALTKTFHEMFSGNANDSTCNLHSIHVPLSTGSDAIRYLDVIYRQATAYLLAGGKQSVFLYRINPNTTLEYIGMISCPYLIKAIRSNCIATTSSCLGVIISEEKSMDFLMYVDSIMSLVPIDACDGEIADGCWSDSGDFLLFLPNISKVKAYRNQIESSTLTLLTEEDEQYGYFQLISNLSPTHYLASIETSNSHKRSLIVFNLSGLSIARFEDPTYSLDTPENSPPFFHALGIPLKISTLSNSFTNNDAVATILFSSHSPDASVLCYTENTGDIRVSLPLEDEDLATLPVVPSDYENDENEFDTFCMGIVADYSCPWMLQASENNSSTFPLILIMNTVGWIVAYSFVLPQSSTIWKKKFLTSEKNQNRLSPVAVNVEHKKEQPLSESKQDNVLSKALPPKPADACGSIGSSSDASIAETPKTINPVPEEPLRNSFQNVRVDSTKELENVPRQSSAQDEKSADPFEALDVPRDSAIYKILKPISEEIDQICKSKGLEIPQFPSDLLDKVPYNELSFELSSKIESLKAALDQVKSLVPVIADIQQSIKIVSETKSIDTVSSSFPMDVFLKEKFEHHAETVSKLEDRINRLKARMRVLQPFSTEPSSVSWQQRIKELEIQTTSIEDELEILEENMKHKLSFKRPSFSFGLTDEDCVVQSLKSKETKGTTLWDHLLTPSESSSKEKEQQKQVPPLINPLLEKYEKEFEQKSSLISSTSPALAFPDSEISLSSFKEASPSSLLKEKPLFSTPFNLSSREKPADSALPCITKILESGSSPNKLTDSGIGSNPSFPATGSTTTATSLLSSNPMSSLEHPTTANKPAASTSFSFTFPTIKENTKSLETATPFTFNLSTSQSDATSKDDFILDNGTKIEEISSSKPELRDKISDSVPDVPTSQEKIIETKPNEKSDVSEESLPVKIEFPEETKVGFEPQDKTSNVLSSSLESFSFRSVDKESKPPSSDTILTSDSSKLATSIQLGFLGTTSTDSNTSLKSTVASLNATAFSSNTGGTFEGFKIASTEPDATSGAFVKAEDKFDEKNTGSATATASNTSLFEQNMFGSTFGKTSFEFAAKPTFGISGFNSSTAPGSTVGFGATTANLFGASSNTTTDTQKNLPFSSFSSFSSFNNTSNNSFGQVAPTGESIFSLSTATDVSLAPFIPQSNDNPNFNTSSKPTSASFTKFRD